MDWNWIEEVKNTIKVLAFPHKHSTWRITDYAVRMGSEGGVDDDKADGGFPNLN